MATVTDPRDIILAPVISEKSYGLIEDNTYTFIVAPESNKTQIKIAIEKIFDVKVDSVNTANRKGKRKRTRAGYGQRKSTKRAIVTLAAGSDAGAAWAGLRSQTVRPELDSGSSAARSAAKSRAPLAPLETPLRKLS